MKQDKRCKCCGNGLQDYDLEIAPGTGLCYACDHARNQFAAAALTGMLASPKIEGTTTGLAQQSFHMADLMMKARKGE